MLAGKGLSLPPPALLTPGDPPRSSPGSRTHQGMLMGTAGSTPHPPKQLPAEQARVGFTRVAAAETLRCQPAGRPPAAHHPCTQITLPLWCTVPTAPPGATPRPCALPCTTSLRTPNA